MYVLITSKQNKEEKAIEEIISILYQKDPNVNIVFIGIKPGLSCIETNLDKKELKEILLKSKKGYFIKVIPIDLKVKDYKEAIYDFLIKNKEKIKDSSFAIRCTSRFKVSSKQVEIEAGRILKENNLKINLRNPDYVIVIEPIKDEFFISFLSLKDYQFFLNKKKI